MEAKHDGYSRWVVLRFESVFAQLPRTRRSVKIDIVAIEIWNSILADGLGIIIPQRCSRSVESMGNQPSLGAVGSRSQTW